MTTSGAGVVTFLFTDLVGSTALIDRLGDDAADSVRRDHFDVLRKAVEEAGGEEVKNLGDGLMVSFASPAAALACAVAMQRALAGSDQRIRIGVHAGEPAQEGDDYFGTPVVVAKRLCDRAEGGQILATELLAGLVGTRGGYQFLPRGRLALKGLSEPVATVEVRWQEGEAADGPVAPVRRRASRSTRPRGPGIVGRDHELAVLDDELAGAAVGELRCVLISGEPGVGKTRLVRELLARHDEVTALTARAHPMGDTTAFGLWAEALEGHLRHVDARDITTLCGGYLEDLASLLRSVAAVRGSPPASPPSRSALLEGITVLIEHLAGDAPVVVLLDDIHQADASSLDALSYLAANLGDAPVLVLLTARTGELAEHPLANRVLLPLEQDGILTRLPVVPLDEEDLGALAASVLRVSPPPALVPWLQARSRGNPLFAVGLMRALLDEGADLTAPRLRRLPEDLTERLQALLVTLDAPALAVLELLTVLGRPATIEELGTLTTKSDEDLSARLDELTRQRTISEEARGGEPAFAVSHPLVQETIYASIGTARRRLLHREIGRALLANGQAAEAAPHFARSASRSDAEAIEALRLALREAEDRRAFRETLAVMAGLVEILPEGDERWLQIADVISGEVEWAEQPDPSRADAELGIRALRAIDAVLGPAGDPVRRGTLKVRLSVLLSWGTGDTVEGERVAREAEALFLSAGDSLNALVARHEAAWARGLSGDIAFLASESEAVVRQAEAAGNTFLTILGLAARAMADIVAGRFTYADEALAAAMPLATGGMRRPPTVLRVSAALSRALQGHASDARRLWTEARDADPRFRDGPFLGTGMIACAVIGDMPWAVSLAEERLAWSGAALTPRQSVGFACAAYAARETGDRDAAQRYLTLSRESHGYAELLFEEGLGGGVAALLDADEGWKGACERLEGAIARLEGIPAPPFAAVLLLDLAEVAAGQADDRAEIAAARLTRIAAGLDRDVYRVMATIAASWGALGSRSPERAVALAREALAILKPLELPLLRGRAYDVLGRGLCHTDLQTAREAFGQAVLEFDACGAVRRRDRAAVEVERLAP